MLFNKKFILASKSKSRSFILNNNNLNFIQIPPDCDEELIKKQNIRKKVSLKKISLYLAKSKAQSVSIKRKQTLVVGSDTIIDLKKHHIYSSAVAYFNNKLVWKTTQKTTVKLRKLNKEEINQYLKKTNKSVLNSVGCFQIEKDGPNIIENIKGDFFNVMGFPLFPFLKFLKKFNIKK